MGRALLPLSYGLGVLLAGGAAGAADYTLGLTGGGIFVGRRFAPAVTPQFGVRWISEAGWLIAVQEAFHFLPARSVDGFGAYNHISAGIGRAWRSADFNVGVAMPSYIMLACNGKLCGRVWGLGFGAYLQANWWSGPVGLSGSVHVDWVGGASLVLPAGLVAMAVAGPLVRW